MKIRLRMLASIALSLLVFSAIGVALLSSVRTPAHASGSNPKITLSPNFGPPTSTTTVSGTNFAASEQITIQFNSRGVGTTTTDSTGAFSATIKIPHFAQPAQHSVTALGQTSGLSATATFLVETNWPTYGFNMHHARYNPFENILTPRNVTGLKLNWSTNIANTGGTTLELSSTPAVVNKYVYVGSQDGNLYALKFNSGALLWKFPTGGPILSSPALDSSNVYVGSSDGNLYAINATTGQQVWSFTTGGPIDSSPVISNGVVYVGSRDHKVYAVNTATGLQVWAFTTGGAVDSSPAVSTSAVYIGSADGDLYAIKISTGLQSWSFATGGAIDSSPTVSNSGLLYVGSTDDKLYAIKTKGSVVWSATTGGPIYSSPAVEVNTVYIGSSDGSLYAFNATTGGAPLWTTPTGAAIEYSSPAVANQVVYIASTDDKLYAINHTTGKVDWSASTGNIIESSPTVTNGYVYLSANDGNLYAYHL